MVLNRPDGTAKPDSLTNEQKSRPLRTGRGRLLLSAEFRSIRRPLLLLVREHLHRTDQGPPSRGTRDSPGVAADGRVDERENSRQLRACKRDAFQQALAGSVEWLMQRTPAALCKRLIRIATASAFAWVQSRDDPLQDLSGRTSPFKFGRVGGLSLALDARDIRDPGRGCLRVRSISSARAGAVRAIAFILRPPRLARWRWRRSDRPRSCPAPAAARLRCRPGSVARLRGIAGACFAQRRSPRFGPPGVTVVPGQSGAAPASTAGPFRTPSAEGR